MPHLLQVLMGSGVTKKVDIYSAGVLIYEASELTGCTECHMLWAKFI